MRLVNNKKRPELKFNPGLALIGLRTTFVTILKGSFESEIRLGI